MFDVHCFISPFGKIHCCVVSVVLYRLQRVSPLVQVHFFGIDFLFANIKIILSKFQIGLCLSIA